ncbi:MAG: hypothetical protein ACKOZN_00940 [Cyanobium sp.]
MARSPGNSGHDRQWELNCRNFEGRWCGSSHWFLRDDHGVLDLEQPSRVIDGTCYAISFSDPFDPGLFLQELPGGGLPLVAGCVDGLVFAVPELLPAGAFGLQVGCRVAADRFDLISIAFGADRRLQAWERRRFRPAGG